MSQLNGKCVVVTGGAGVLGRCFARGIADHGGVAIVADVDIGAARDVAAELAFEHPEKIEAAHLDITDMESIDGLLAELMRRYGRVDAVVNNAYPRNANYGQQLEYVMFSDFCENVNMHLGGYFLVAQRFCLVFKEQGFGNIINISSIYGTIPPRFGIYEGTQMSMPVEYAAIKAAVQQLTRYFAQYFKKTGIRVNSLSPGGILADQPTKFLAAYNRDCATKGMLLPKDILGALLFLLSDDSQYITGQNLIVDDGFSL